MKFIILQSKLKEIIQVIERIIPKSSTLPILNNILLTTKENFLKLSATDLEIGINCWLLAKIEKEGKIAVPAQTFSHLINFLPPEALNLEIKDNNLLLEGKNIKTQIKGFGAEDFPIIPEIDTKEKIVLNGFSLCQAIAQIVGIAAFSTVRPEISGVLFQIKKNCLILTATDAFRLGEKKIFFEKPLNIAEEYSFILPQKAVSQIVAIFQDKERKINFYISPNLVMFETQMEEVEHPGIQFVSKLIEGEYPKYEEIIPKSFKTEAIVSKEEFLNQVKAASIFASRINEIKIGFHPEEKRLKIFCQNPDLGSYSSELPGEMKGKKTELSFNYKFLLDGIINVKGKKVFFACSEEKEGEEGPAILKSPDDETYLYVAMPIQAS